MTPCEGFTFLIVFEFLMLDSKCGQNGVHESSLLGVEFCRTIYGPLIKLLLMNLKMIFL
jgi:hypothetical protein